MSGGRHSDLCCARVEETQRLGIKLTKLNFSSPIHDIANEIFELIILRKFDGGEKTNLRDGCVERPIHGVQHASRVSIFIKIFCEFYKLLAPEYAAELTEENIKILQIVGLLHDAARENDFQDLWEQQSQVLCEEYLIQLGVDSNKAEILSNLILLKEDGGLFGRIFQSADCLDIPRCRKKFFLERMSAYQDAKKHGKQEAIIQIAQNVLPMLALQYELGSDVEVYAEGKLLFAQVKTLEPNRMALKANYEHADNGFIKTELDLDHFPLLQDFYQEKINKIDPIKFSEYPLIAESLIKEHTFQTLIDPRLYQDFLEFLQKIINRDAEITISDFFKIVFNAKENFPNISWDVLRKCLEMNYPKFWSKRAYFLRYNSPNLYGPCGNGEHEYFFKDKESAYVYLNFLKICLNDEDIQNKQLYQDQYKSQTIYFFSLDEHQIQLEDQLKFSVDTLIKNIRWDANCFIRECLDSITPKLNSGQSEKKPLRPGPHKRYTVFTDGIYTWENRRERFMPEQLKEFLNKKDSYSSHQSTSLSFFEHQAKVFSHNKNQNDKNVILIFDPFDNYFNRLFIYNGGSIRRPWEFNEKKDAVRYHEKMVYENKTLYSNYELFKKAILENPNKYNEALYYLRWNILTSSVGIASDTFEARCIAQHYAALALLAVKAQYKVLGKPLPENYEIPIQYYLPSYQNHGNLYSRESQVRDRVTAESIFHDDKKFIQKMQEDKPEFMLLLGSDICEKLLYKSYLNVNLIGYLIVNGYFELVDTIYEKTATSKHKSLKVFLKENILLAADKNYIRSREMMVIEKSAMWVAAKKGRWDLLPVFRYQYASQDSKGNTILMYAAKCGDIEILSQLLRIRNIPLNMVDKHDKSALILAVENQHENIVSQLLHCKDVNVNLQDEDDYTALMYAVAKNAINMVRLLLKHPKVNPNMQNGVKRTALMMAIERKEFDIIRALLLHPNMDVNLKDSEGNTALMLALVLGDEKIIRELLNHPQINVNLPNRSHQTAIMFAAYHGHSHIVDLLMLKNNLDLNVTDLNDNSALIFSIVKRQPHIARQMISHPSININLQNYRGNTALHYALIHAQFDIAFDLLQHPHIHVGLANKKGMTPLQLASQHNRVDLVRCIAVKLLKSYLIQLIQLKNTDSNYLNFSLNGEFRSNNLQNKINATENLSYAIQHFPGYCLSSPIQKIISSDQVLKQLMSHLPESMKSVLLISPDFKLSFKE